MKEELLLSEFRSCVKVEVAVLGPRSRINLTVSVNVKHSERRTVTVRAHELCKSRGGRPGPCLISLISLVGSVGHTHNK